MIVAKVILPTFLILGIGYLAARVARFDVPTLSNLAIYILTPSLVFHRLYVSRMDVSFLGRIGLFAVLLVLVVYAMAWTVSVLLRLSPQDSAAFRLSSALFNAGNMGLPIVLFAFGEQGLAYAIVLVVCHVLITNTFGVFVAARATHSPAGSFRQMFALPGLYAILAAFVLAHAGVIIPDPVLKPIELLGTAAIPVNTAILGIQLSYTKLGEQVGLAAGTATLRLLVSPLLSVALLRLVGISGLAYKVLLLQSGMPAAVYSVILSARFGANRSIASSAVFFSTLLSAFSLSVLLLFLAG